MPFLRHPTGGTGVTVTALCPGPVQTELTETAHRSVAGAPKTVPGLSHVSAREVVRYGLAAVERGRALAIPGFIMKLGMTLVRLTPMPILRLVSRFTAKRS